VVNGRVQGLQVADTFSPFIVPPVTGTIVRLPVI
jgi:hypothetical protein